MIFRPSSNRDFCSSSKISYLCLKCPLSEFEKSASQLLVVLCNHPVIVEEEGLGVRKMSEDNLLDAGKVFDALLHEIETAEKELGLVQEKLKNQQLGQTPAKAQEVAVLAEEIGLLQKAPLEGLVDDDGTKYYLAVGELEEQVKSLKELKEVTDIINKAHERDLKELKKNIADQTRLNSRLRDEVTKSKGQEVGVEGSRNSLARRQTNGQIRANKVLLEQFKNELVTFLDDTARLDPNHVEGDPSPFGYLLQTLWSSFLKSESEWVSVKSLEYDVPDEVLEHLVTAEVVLRNPADPDEIRMEDFTMRETF